MLVLSRKVDETILIADGIKVTVVFIGSDKVRLGIEAPKDVPILRGELGRSARECRKTRCLNAMRSSIEQDTDTREKTST